MKTILDLGKFVLVRREPADFLAGAEFFSPYKNPKWIIKWVKLWVLKLRTLREQWFTNHKDEVVKSLTKLVCDMIDDFAKEHQ